LGGGTIRGGEGDGKKEGGGRDWKVRRRRKRVGDRKPSTYKPALPAPPPPLHP
jgi:hypothetical protein